ncbi:unnamed protein product [Protopolystoma xenopodis]|uniref:RCK N-terminal domain-containing protein n=1 Tax=Protopolystoma xenopodis TaxID=117903 RepID=A0A3S5B3E3_9PLAT|nr:unnamed protein product [Protopolystoma xenopodis]
MNDQKIFSIYPLLELLTTWMDQSASQASEYHFRNHILVCLVGPTAGGPINLSSFVMPLRFHWLDIQDIVILGDSSLISDNEWIKLKNFPRFFIINVSLSLFVPLLLYMPSYLHNSSPAFLCQ